MCPGIWLHLGCRALNAPAPLGSRGKTNGETLSLSPQGVTEGVREGDTSPATGPRLWEQNQPVWVNPGRANPGVGTRCQSCPSRQRGQSCWQGGRWERLGSLFPGTSGEGWLLTRCPLYSQQMNDFLLWQQRWPVRALLVAPSALPKLIPESLSSAGLLPAARSCHIQPRQRPRSSEPMGAEPEGPGERLGWRRGRRGSRKELWLRLGSAAAQKNGEKTAREPPAHAGLCPGGAGQLPDNPRGGLSLLASA